MLFNTLQFGLFFTILFLLYWVVAGKSNILQKALLLAGSYLFYATWDWRFLFLLAGMALGNYGFALLIGTSEKRAMRKIWLVLGLMLNAGILVFFKYFYFLVNEFQFLFTILHVQPLQPTFRILVPVGISFYTFLSVSYLVDVYRKQLDAERNPFDLMLSLSFFPIVLAGPIERPRTLLPQIKSLKIFEPDLAADGLRQFVWGLSVKMIIADNCATFADKVFADPGLNGSVLLFGALFYAIQIYADFSSYSDMAIGISKLFGFRLGRNFNYPYFAKDIADFWRRWHMSLTSWFRDYIFLPLAYFLSGKIKSQNVLSVPSEHLIYILSIIFTWSLTGFWHGASYTFLAWGLIHAALLIIHQVFKKPRNLVLKKLNLRNDPLYLFSNRMITLLAVVAAWVFFRSATTGEAFSYFSRMLTMQIFAAPAFFPASLVLPVAAFFIVEWFQRDAVHGLDLTLMPKTRAIRWSVYLFLLLLVFLYQDKPQEFLYFKF